MEDIGDRIHATFTAMGEEEKETCIHCGKTWYKIYYRDGVCHDCQKLHRPGRAQILQTRKNRRRAAMFFVAGVLALALAWALGS